MRDAKSGTADPFFRERDKVPRLLQIGLESFRSEILFKIRHGHRQNDMDGHPQRLSLPRSDEISSSCDAAEKLHTTFLSLRLGFQCLELLTNQWS